MSRIIKPYIPLHDVPDDDHREDYERLDARIKKMYTTPDGADILPELESPPISTNFMENYLSTSRFKSAKNKRTLTKKAYIDSDADVEDHDLIQEENTNHGNAENFLMPEKSRAFKAGSQRTVDVLPPISGSANNNSKLNGKSTILNSSDSDLGDNKKKTGRRLPFSRIFKGRKESSDSNRKNVSKRKLNSHNGKKHIAFDMNFDYDENLEEDDDEDDDEDEDGEDLHSQFFQLETESSKGTNANGTGDKDTQFNRATSSNSLGTNTNTSTNSNSNTNIGGNNIKKKAHFPQNIIPRAPLLDGGKNSSSRSDRLLKGGAHDDLITLAAGSENDTNVEAGDDISDMESYINEQDLDNLNLDTVPSTNDRSASSKHAGFESGKADETMPGSQEERAPTIGTHDTDSASSYGRSLLDSDFSGDEGFMKQDTSVSDSNSLLNDPDVQPSTVSHSIPMTLDKCGIYHGQDDSTLNNVFDKAVLKIKSSKPQLKERRSSGQLMPHSISSRRFSSSSNLGGKQRCHTRPSSSASTDGSKLKVEHNKKHNIGANDTKQGRLSLAPSLSHSRANSRDDLFSIQKIADFEKPKTTDSQLSLLFNRKKKSAGNAADLLDYFSFVSGNKVPKYEATDLTVYIQASKRYRRKSFKASVRKSATIFEAIGYILYLFSTDFKPDNFEKDGLTLEEIQNPNNFCLKIVDEDGEPFEDDFGKLDRKKLIQVLSDNEVVLCKVDVSEEKQNEKETPLPFDLNGEIINKTEALKSGDGPTITGINQLSYYKPIVGNNPEVENIHNSKLLEVKVYLYPSSNKMFNYTTINVLVTSTINDILVKYCRMKNMDPNEYLLIVPDKRVALNLNDTVLTLDGHDQVEIISKKDARELHLEKTKFDMRKPNLPTIQSNGLTPVTLDVTHGYLKPEQEEKVHAVKETKTLNKPKKLGPKHKLGLTTQVSESSNASGSANATGGFFKSKNSSKSSLHGSYYAPNRLAPNVDGSNVDSSGNNFQDLFSGAYHKYKVWRRQQMSLMNKHERALALDGDYIYIVPPEKHLHWHENVKTKSIHISQVILVKKSKRVPEYFKLFFKRGQNDIKRYYFEAVSPQECNEIVSRIQNSLNAYRMNHK